MIRNQNKLETTVVASDDSKHTYEIRRKWDENRRTGVVIELYPTISAEKAGEMDLSTMHLMNHVKDFEWGAVRVVNLYSTVIMGKPSTNMLTQDMKNVAYIEDVLEEAKAEDSDIVIAWGSSLSRHMNTVETKTDLLGMMKDKGLQARVKCIVAGSADEETMQGTHPLFLGLHYGREEWRLKAFDIDKALGELEALLGEKAEKKKVKNKKSESNTTAGLLLWRTEKVSCLWRIFVVFSQPAVLSGEHI